MSTFTNLYSYCSSRRNTRKPSGKIEHILKQVLAFAELISWYETILVALQVLDNWIYGLRNIVEKRLFLIFRLFSMATFFTHLGGKIYLIYGVVN